MSEHHRTGSWAAAVRVNRPRIAAALPSPCVDCGRPVFPDQKWQVGHIVSVARGKAMGWTTAEMNAPSNLGPSHTKARGQRACNQIAGGREGAKIAAARKRAGSNGPPVRDRTPVSDATPDDEYPSW